MPYNTVAEITSIQDLRDIFPDDYDPQVNWLFCSTSGQHGTYTTLNEVMDIIKGVGKIAPFKGKKSWVTVLVVQPRLCNLRYGDILVGESDIPWLRTLVRNTLDAVKKSQEGNV